MELPDCTFAVLAAVSLFISIAKLGIIDCNADFVHKGTWPASCGLRNDTGVLPVTAWMGDHLEHNRAPRGMGRHAVPLVTSFPRGHVRLRMHMTKLRHAWLKEGFRRRDTFWGWKDTVVFTR